MEIERLLNKLANRELSEEEMKELAACFQEKTPSAHINKHFIKVWDNCHKYNSDLDSDILLHSIHTRLNISPDIEKKWKKTFLFPNLLKYAAIFIVAFSLSWFLNNQYKKQFVTGRANNTGVHEVLVSQGSKSKIKLSDGSVVKLNSGSRLSYPAVFNDKNRQVYLEGEAYFEVKADSSRPFFVNTTDITVKVIGTSFNLKSYPECNTIETTLVSGSLEIFDKSFIGSIESRSARTMILKPNQKAIYIKDRQKLTLEERKELKLEHDQMKVPKLSLQDQIDTHSLTAWKDGKLIFKEEKFEDLAIKLERWYDVKIIIKSQKLKKERFTGIFENETTEQVLNALIMAEPFEYTMNKNIITIYDSEHTL
jgi:ferric-dicitrate binding protein FerR (iron transport regulator)